MTLIDWLILVVLLVSVLSAAKKGFFLEVFSLAGVIAGLLLASWNYQRVLPWMTRWIHTWQVAEVFSFLLIALVVMILAGLLGRIVRWSVHWIGLGWADRFVGAIFGLVKGCVLVTLAVLVIAAFLPQATWLSRSRFVPYFLIAAHQAAVITPHELGERIREGIVVIRNAQPSWLSPSAAVVYQVCSPGPSISALEITPGLSRAQERGLL